MDIQQWLVATAHRAPPPPSDDHHMPHAAWERTHSQDQEQWQGRFYRRKRKRASSDSSIIAQRAPRATARNRTAAPRSLPSERARSAISAESRSQQSYSSRHGPGSPETAPSKTYERRPRHKTRADRYEPKQRKRKGDQDARNERKSGNKRRKSHRSGDGGRTVGLVQSFQLKNGPKNNRLTVGVTPRRMADDLRLITDTDEAGHNCWSLQAWASFRSGDRTRCRVYVTHFILWSCAISC